MSRLDDLLTSLCPDGVEFKKVGSICKILRGKRLTTKDLLENGEYPVIHGGMTPMGFYDKANRKAGTTIVINTGNAGCVFYIDHKFWSSDACFSLYPDQSILDRYLYFYVSSKEKVLKGKIRAGAMPTIDSSVVESLIIPVPPLEVQQEIVRILDSFTALTAELQAELQVRKRQYGYYKDALLPFEKENVEWKQLGDISTIVRGASPRPIKNFITDSPNGVNWIKIGDVSPEAKYITSCAEKITAEGAGKSRLVKPGDFILSNSMSFGRPYILQIEGCIHDGWLAISDFDNYVTADYLYHILTSNYIQKEMRQKASFGGAVQNLNADIVRGIEIPIPSKSEQNNISTLLDKFSLLCTDISSGLPAEIEARQKQYEYYRDKLLTFKELRA